MKGIDVVKKLQPAKFKYNRTIEGLDDSRFHIGFIAQDLAKVFPMNEYGVVGEKDGYLYINYHELIPVLVMAIKEQQLKIEELERRLNG